MSLRAALHHILTEWPKIKDQDFARHSLASFFRNKAPRAVAAALKDATGLRLKGSAGTGQWATVPWVAVFDEVVTSSATIGYYLVYLFHPSKPLVHLSLNQGAIHTRLEFGSRSKEVLRSRADLMRLRIADYRDFLDKDAIDLGSGKSFPDDYAAGHVMGASYTLEALPSDEKLVEDLTIALKAYRALIFRGGFEVSEAPTTEEEKVTLEENRRYIMHWRIERNARAASLVKKLHGVRCQACNMEFREMYGSIGDGYIEAHHLRPLSTLNEETIVNFDVATDFAVLCANCHRMIHKMEDPSDLEGFRARITGVSRC